MTYYWPTTNILLAYYRPTTDLLDLISTSMFVLIDCKSCFVCNNLTDLLLTFYWPTTGILPTYHNLPSYSLDFGAWHSCTEGLVIFWGRLWEWPNAMAIKRLLINKRLFSKSCDQWPMRPMRCQTHLEAVIAAGRRPPYVPAPWPPWRRRGFDPLPLNTSSLLSHILVYLLWPGHCAVYCFVILKIFQFCKISWNTRIIEIFQFCKISWNTRIIELVLIIALNMNQILLVTSVMAVNTSWVSQWAELAWPVGGWPVAGPWRSY